MTRMGSRIADAEGLAAGEPIEEVRSEVAEVKFGVAVQRRRQHGGGEAGGVVESHSLAKEVEAGGGQREAYGVGVASEAGEESVGGVDLSVDGGEGVEEMEAGDGAAGAVGLAVFVGEDEGGTAGAVDYAGGEDAEDAAMPGWGRRGRGTGGEGLVRAAHGFELGFDGREGVWLRWRGGRR